MIAQHKHSKPIIKAASACVWRGDEVLLVQRASALGRGLWSFPGGKVEQDESTLEAARRELFEETGVVAALDTFVGDYTVELADFDFVISCFTGAYVQGDAVAATDARHVAWVDWRDIDKFSLAPNIAIAVRTARKVTSV